MSSRFHLAIPVRSIEESKEFYCDFLGCEEGNCEEGKWQDINFWGKNLGKEASGKVAYRIHGCMEHTYIRVRI